MFKKLMETLKEKFTKSDSKKALIPRAPRIKVLPLHDISLWIPKVAELPLEVSNISVTGLGLILDPKNNMVEGNHYGGTLSIAGRNYPLMLRVVRNNESVLGCAFEGDITLLRQVIYEHFIAEIMAMDISQVNTTHLKPDERGTPKWFFGQNNSEIYVTEMQGRITYFHVMLLGNYIEAYADGPPRFGYIVSQEGKNKMRVDQSPLIQFTDTMPLETLDLTYKFVMNVAALTNEQKIFVTSVLSELIETAQKSNA